MDRYEFYKSRAGGTYAVSTCDCCRDGRFRDARFWARGAERSMHCGLAPSHIATLTLITERDAYKRRPGLIQGWSWNHG